MNFLRWLPAILWLIIISLLSFSSLEQITLPDGLGLDKIAHFLMYFILEFFMLIPSINHRKLFLMLSLAAIIFSAITELIQHYFILNRFGDLWDFAANLLGILFAGIIIEFKIKN